MAALLLVAALVQQGAAQEADVLLGERWVATVDEGSQQIMLYWSPSPTAGTMGYHLCSGLPCVDYDTVFGRMDTTYVCLDHSPLQRHTYRMHVFDSTYNVSALTPSFGNMVLEAEIPACSNAVTARWTPYSGLPEGTAHYRLMAWAEPVDTGYREYYATDDSTALQCTVEIPDEVTTVRMKVQASGPKDVLSMSNVVYAVRRTADTASELQVLSASYDSTLVAMRLTLAVDTAFPYLLQRCGADGLWTDLRQFRPDTFPYVLVDTDLPLDDTLVCYRLAVSDACGKNTRYSPSLCATLPRMREAAVMVPNMLLAGDAANGTFRPCVQGMRGDVYELDIYNRQGNLVFHTDDPATGWSPSADVPQGTYVYTLRCRTLVGEEYRSTGLITVLK